MLKRWSTLVAVVLAAVVVLVALPCAQAGMPDSVILTGEVDPYGLFGARGGVGPSPATSSTLSAPTTTTTTTLFDESP